jgi:thymidylate kinase
MAIFAVFTHIPKHTNESFNLLALVCMLQVRGAFQQLKEPSWLVVDASQSVEQIHEQVRSHAVMLPAAPAALQLC